MSEDKRNADIVRDLRWVVPALRARIRELEAAKAEARAEALRELLQVNRVHRDKNWYPSLEQSILALIPSSSSTNQKHDE